MKSKRQKCRSARLMRISPNYPEAVKLSVLRSSSNFERYGSGNSGSPALASEEDSVADFDEILPDRSGPDVTHQINLLCMPGSRRSQKQL
jgi:hypothetical protein